MKYRAEIDGLRALAIVPVVLFHAGFEIFSGGFVGVDVFFVISGYLITTIILQEKDKDTFSLSNFYERRARRILPALFLVMFASLPLAWLWLLPSEMQDFSQSLFAVITFSSNIYFWNDISYWGTANALKPMLHTWSLAVEEQYYVLFPLFLMLMWKFRKRWILASFLVLAVLSLLLAQWGAYHKPHATFFLLPTRAWELAIGAAIAFYFLYRKHETRWILAHKSINEAMGVLGFLMIGYAVYVFDKNVPFPSVYALVPTLGAGFIILFSSSETWVGKVLGSKMLVGVGLLSYSAYLWHQPLFAFARQYSVHPLSDTLLLSLSLAAFILSYFSWRFVEAPFRQRGRVSQKKFVLFAIAGTLFFGCIGLAGHYTQGFPNRVTSSGQSLIDLEEKVNANHGLSGTCDDGFTLSPDCRTSDAPEIVVWGDSYAMHLVKGILASNPDAKIIQMTKNTCGPFFDIAPIKLPRYSKQWARQCIAFNDQVYAWLQSSETIKYAVISSPFQKYLSHNQDILLKNGELTKGSYDFTLQTFHESLSKLTAIGITPIIFTPPPATGFNFGQCLTRVDSRGGDLDQCNFTVKDLSKLQVETYKFLSAIGKDYKVIDLKNMICADEKCVSHLGSSYIYRDSGHLAVEGSQLLGKQYDFYHAITGSVQDAKK
ncbi:MAG: acyltransferase family protein [Mariprofundaceae bacterium]|nr:acyltransferase family protein [Mariprofundaceae bacterium]